jgi:AraC-like DNA-binding protein
MNAKLIADGEPTPPQNDDVVFSRLRNSTAYNTYRTAFTELTNLPLSLEPTLGSKAPREGTDKTNGFCLLFANSDQLSCANCRWGRLRRYSSGVGPGTVCSIPCGAGLNHGIAPVRFGSFPVAFLVVGQYLTRLPSADEVDRLQQRWDGAGAAGTTLQTYRETFVGTRVLSPDDHRQAMSMLAACAERLSGLINYVLLQLDGTAPEAVRIAVAMIGSNGGCDLGLDEIAQRCGIPTGTLSSSFRDALGFDFHDYKIRRRLEGGRKALIAPQPASVAEASDLAACSTVAEFRQLFEDYLGESPESYQLRMEENCQLMRGGVADGYGLSLAPLS